MTLESLEKGNDLRRKIIFVKARLEPQIFDNVKVMSVLDDEPFFDEINKLIIEKRTEYLQTLQKEFESL